MLTFNSLLRFRHGASAALRAISGHVLSRPGRLADYDGWSRCDFTSEEWGELPPQQDPWASSPISLDHDVTRPLWYLEPTQLVHYVFIDRSAGV